MTDGEREPWMADALCAETDPEAFFPEKGGSAQEAITICRACDVTADCLVWALRRPLRDDFGVAGGTTAQQRRELRKAKKAAA